MGETESQFLQRQSREARLALRRAWDQAQSALRSGLAIGPRAARHPLLALGASVAAGFGLSAWILPAVRRSKTKFNGSEPIENPQPAPAAVSSSRSLGWLLVEALRVAGPLLGAMLSERSPAREGAGYRDQTQGAA
ncbi:MAG: hypothetical protein ACREJC_11215 [Tepidisphaeraceae bacterium]